MKVRKNFTITEKAPVRVYVVCALKLSNLVWAVSVIMKLCIIFGNLRFKL